MRCDACGFELAPTAKFCSECGEPIQRPKAGPAPSARTPPSSSSHRGESAAASVEGERRQITVLFSDLVGSTAIASRLDPEDWREVVSAYQDTCSSAVHRFGGYVAQYLGDGLVVYFGFPAAHEDDALRAIRAGLAVVDALADLSPRLSRFDVKLAARIGVHTGTVVVGEVGATGRRETLALGDTTNFAARLQDLAAPNTVVLSAATFRLVRGHFVTEELGVRSLKGIEKPAVLYRAIRPVRIRSTLALGEESTTPLVGRTRELALLLNRWELAVTRRGQVVVVSGEPGLGKSRIAAALRQKLSDHPHTWLECRASAYMQDTPLYPIVTLQEDALDLAGFERPEQKTAQLERSLEQAGMSPAEHLALFTELQGLPLPPRYGKLALSAEVQRRRTLDSFVEWFLRLSEEQALVALFEDVHWIDPTTLELLSRLVEGAATHRILLVLTHRPAFTPPWPKADHLTFLELSRLGRDDSSALVSHLEALKSRLPEILIHGIVERSDGVPLFLEELTKAVLEAIALDPGDSQKGLAVPSSLKDSLMARLDQLGPAKELAQHCASLGREFTLELVRATTSLDDENLRLSLERLVAAQLFQQRGTPPVYSFRHALVQEQAYESLLKTTRQANHKVIAEALSEKFPQIAANQPEILAHHCFEAGLFETAVGYFLSAGQKSMARSANVEASRQLRRGLEALGRLPESAGRDQQELLLLTMRAVALIAVRGYASPEVEQAFERARALCHALGDTPHLFPVLFGLCLFYLVRARAAPTHELRGQLETIARSTDDVEYVLEMHSATAAVRFWEGRFLEAHEHILRARTMFDPGRHGHHMFVYGQDPIAYGYGYGALILFFLGYFEQARLSQERALELATRSNHPLTLAGVLSFSADLFYHLRLPAAFDELAERSITMAAEQNLPMWVGANRTLRGWARCQRGDLAGGIAEIEAGLADFRKTGADLNTPYFVSRLARAYFQAGRVEDAIAAIDEAILGMESALDRYYEAELRRLKGEFLRERSPDAPAESERCFAQALGIARAQNSKSLELRVAMSLGALWASQGKKDEAQSLVEGIHGWFTEGLDMPDLVDARALLETWR